MSWSVSKQELPPNPPLHVANANGSSAQVSLPKPTSGQIIYYIGCTVDFTYGGQPFSASFVQHTVSNVPGTAMIGWSGNPATGKFALVGAYVSTEDEGYELQFLIYFWGLV